MHILMTGGTGLIGSELCRHWADTHQITVWSRRPEAVAAICGAPVRGIAQLDDYGEGPLDAVVNLAGAPIADRRWSARRKQMLLDSRVKLTEQLVAWLAARSLKPGRLISGSAVGWYGDGGELDLIESSPPVTRETRDFASELCQAWEVSANRAQHAGIAVATVRTGLVLAPKGGMLGRMLPPFRLGLGGPIGNGRQWMPWIHLRDQVRIVDFLLHHPEVSGAWNACAPNPVRNAEFAHALASALYRPAILPAPAAVLRLGLGELAGLLLGGQRALPARLAETEFRFDFPTLDVALSDLLGSSGKHSL